MRCLTVLSTIAWRRKPAIGHLLGDANLASDAVSRAEREVLRRLAKNLRIRLTQLTFPPSCQSILDRVLAYAVARGIPVRPNPYQSTQTMVPSAYRQHLPPHRPVPRPLKEQRPSSPLPRLHAPSINESGLGKGRRDRIDGDGPRSSSPSSPPYSSSLTNLPCELFGLGRCPSCADYDGPPGGTSLQLCVSSTELGKLFRAAERALVKHSEGSASSESQLPSIDTSRACVQLLRALGIESVKLSSQLALMAALDKLHRPSKFDTDKQYWEAYGASRSNFLAYVRLLREAMASLPPPVEQLMNLVPLSWGQGSFDVAQISDHPAVLMLQPDPQLPSEVFGLGRCPSCCDYDGPGRLAAAKAKVSLPPPRASITKPSRLYMATHAPLCNPSVSQSKAAPSSTGAASRPAEGRPSAPSRMASIVVGGQRFAAPTGRKERATSMRKTAMLELARERALSMAPVHASEQQRADLVDAVRATHELAEFGAAYGTLDKDDHAWEYWERFCKLYGWETSFTAEYARRCPNEICERLAIFQSWVYPQLKGRGGRSDAKPRTAFNNYVLAILSRSWFKVG